MARITAAALAATVLLAGCSDNGPAEQAQYEARIVEMANIQSEMSNNQNSVRRELLARDLSVRSASLETPQTIRSWICKIEFIGVERIDVYGDGNSAWGGQRLGYNPRGDEIGVLCRNEASYVLVFDRTEENMRRLSTVNVGSQIKFNGTGKGRRATFSTLVTESALQ